MPAKRQLLSVGHSYVVALNRRLAEEMSRVGHNRWEVVVAAPEFVHGDLRPIHLEPSVSATLSPTGSGRLVPDEAADTRCRVEPVGFRFSRRIHLAFFDGRMRQILSGVHGRPWDMVHCWQEPYIVSGAQLAWWTPPRTPLVFATFQNLPKNYPPPFSWMERYALDRAAAWIAFGQTIREALRRRPMYRQRPSEVLTVGVDTQRFRPDPAAAKVIANQLGWAVGGPPVVGFLGRFVPEKGLALLTDTLDALAAATPWRALFVGGGILEPLLRDWAAKHGDRARVVTGVTHDQVPAYLAAMDILAAPSQTTAVWREQLGRMILEAFATAVPVIASDSGEIPNVVAHAGRIVGEADAPAWRAALGELLDNPALRRQLGQAGQDRAKAEFAWPVVAARHLAFFDRLLDGQTGSITDSRT